jgi:transcriptional regulator with XRE-family HTH domain
VKARQADSSGLALFAEELMAARISAGMSQEDLAARLSYSLSLVSMVEGLRRPPTLQFAEQCDQVFATPGTFVRLQKFTRATPLPSWFRPWAEIESVAEQFRSWQPSFVDGLLQTPEYAHALLSVRIGEAGADIDQQVAARMERQAVLSRDDPPLLWVVMDEGVLRRPVGGREVMRVQTERLTEAAAQPNIVIQVIPAAAGAHDGLNGSFVIATFDDSSSAVYLETALTGMIIERSRDIAALTLIYEGLLAEALPRWASAELIKEVTKTWT